MFITYMCYHSSDFDYLSNSFLCYDTIYKCFHFLAINSAHRVEVCTVPVDTFSNDLCFSFEQEWIFTSHCGKWNFFFLDIQSRFCFCNWSKIMFIAYMCYQGSDFNNLRNCFFGYKTIYKCFHFLVINSAYRVEVCTATVDTFSNDLCFSFE